MRGTPGTTAKGLHAKSVTDTTAASSSIHSMGAFKMRPDSGKTKKRKERTHRNEAHQHRGLLNTWVGGRPGEAGGASVLHSLAAVNQNHLHHGPMKSCAGGSASSGSLGVQAGALPAQQSAVAGFVRPLGKPLTAFEAQYPKRTAPRTNALTGTKSNSSQRAKATPSASSFSKRGDSMNSSAGFRKE